MRILAIGDLHGRVPVSKSFLRENRIDIIISPGDLPHSERIRNLIFENWGKIHEEGKNLSEIVGKSKWKKILNEGIKSQAKVLKKLDSLGVPVFLVFGNAEHNNEIKSYLKRSINVRHVGSKSVKLNEINLVGIDAETDGNKKQIKAKKERIRVLLKRVKGPVILISHEPPYGTKFDLVKNKKSPRLNQHVGSKLVKKIIKEFNPLVNVFGHMHESFGKQKFDKTFLVNAGYGHNGYAALIDLTKGKANIKLLKL